MKIRVDKFINGVYKQNCYVVGGQSNSAVIVDPGSDAFGVSAVIEKNGWDPLAIIATHAHFDHVSAVSELLDTYQVPFYIHGDDLPLMQRINLYKFVIEGGEAVKIPVVSNVIDNNTDTLSIGEFLIKVIHTPGHTPGGLCFLIDNHLFTGDTILPAGVGRIDLPGGDSEAMTQSLEVIKKLSSDLIAYPGHGSSMLLRDLLDSAQI